MLLILSVVDTVSAFSDHPFPDFCKIFSLFISVAPLG